jgi:uncharacterized OB-fold protein
VTSTQAEVLDWTRGEEGIAYQLCPGCAGLWSFHRTFCPRCGRQDPDSRQSSGIGTVHAVTLVTRAPGDELRPYAPYLIALVDAEEGFRLMAHGDRSLRIGDRVRARFVTLAGRLMPYFERIADQ